MPTAELASRTATATATADKPSRRSDPNRVGPYGRLVRRGDSEYLTAMNHDGQRLFTETLNSMGGKCVRFMKKTQFAATIRWAFSRGLSEDEIESACYEGLAVAVAQWHPDAGNSIKRHAVVWMRAAVQKAAMAQSKCWLQSGQMEFNESNSNRANSLNTAGAVGSLVDQAEARYDADHDTDARDRRRAVAEGIRRALKRVDARDREIFAAYYGLEDSRPRTLGEVGDEYQVSRSRILQILQRVKRKINGELEELYTEVLA